MLKNIEYPAGFGPDNSQPLEISKSFMIDIPPGYRGDISGGFGGDSPQWEQALCMYSMQSGAKVFEIGNYSRDSSSWYMPNRTPYVISYLLTCWHKKSPPNGNEGWNQTGNLNDLFGYDRVAENRAIIIEFNKFGDLSTIPFLNSSARFELRLLPD